MKKLTIIGLCMATSAYATEAMKPAAHAVEEISQKALTTDQIQTLLDQIKNIECHKKTGEGLDGLNSGLGSMIVEGLMQLGGLMISEEIAKKIGNDSYSHNIQQTSEELTRFIQEEFQAEKSVVQKSVDSVVRLALGGLCMYMEKEKEKSFFIAFGRDQIIRALDGSLDELTNLEDKKIVALGVVKALGRFAAAAVRLEVDEDYDKGGLNINQRSILLGLCEAGLPIIDLVKKAPGIINFKPRNQKRIVSLLKAGARIALRGSFETKEIKKNNYNEDEEFVYNCY